MLHLFHGTPVLMKYFPAMLNWSGKKHILKQGSLKLEYLTHNVRNVIYRILLNNFMVAECGPLKLLQADTSTDFLDHLWQIQLKLFLFLQPNLRQAFSLFCLGEGEFAFVAFTRGNIQMIENPLAASTFGKVEQLFNTAFTTEKTKYKRNDPCQKRVKISCQKKLVTSL